MPKKMEQRLKRIAAIRGFGEARTNAFVYGSMRHEGWKPKRERGTREEKK